MRRFSILASFAALYVLWGATFLAIKIGDRSLPPLLLAALRFLAAGAILYAWGWWRGWPHPTARQWRALAAISLLMFLVGYGVLFWAETQVASGITAVLVALVPLLVAALEAWVLRSAPASWKVLGGCVLGAAGVAVLMLGPGSTRQLPLWPTLALLGASLAWAVGTILIARMDLPRSAGMNAAAQMLLGGTMLAAAAAASGEFGGWHWAQALNPPALWSLAYLILPGSVLAYAVYVWLLGRVAPVRVATYALANPVVALLLGWGWAGETLTHASLAGTIIILAALALVLSRAPAGSGRTAAPLPEEHTADI